MLLRLAAESLLGGFAITCGSRFGKRLGNDVEKSDLRLRRVSYPCHAPLFWPSETSHQLKLSYILPANEHFRVLLLSLGYSSF